VQALVARQRSHARKAARLLSGSPACFGEDSLLELPDSDLTLIATPDDAIGVVAHRLAEQSALTGKVGGHRSSGPTVLHTSGALSSTILEPLALAGFHVGSLHPLVSISDSRAGAKALSTAFFCLEGDTQSMKVAKRIVKDLGARSFAVESHHKALYHAAAVMSSGHVTALLDVTIELLTQGGLAHATAKKVLLPLLESTWKNLTTSDPAEALTGTFARGDEATVEKHLAALRSANNADALAAYQLLGKRSLRLLAQKGGDPAVIKRIKALLNNQTRRTQ
jgi:predicted short-subunit dehydrogenase-like oxidoreductase (DUF2520 family)